MYRGWEGVPYDTRTVLWYNEVPQALGIKLGVSEPLQHVLNDVYASHNTCLDVTYCVSGPVDSISSLVKMPELGMKQQTCCLDFKFITKYDEAPKNALAATSDQFNEVPEGIVGVRVHETHTLLTPYRHKLNCKGHASMLTPTAMYISQAETNRIPQRYLFQTSLPFCG